jgi:hypothetical protein
VDGVEILNRGDSYMRGIQPFVMWTDAELGELTTHQLMMGGNYYSHPSFTGTPIQPGLALDFTVEDPHPLGGTRIVIESVPTELDPDGILGQPGVRTSHGGSVRDLSRWKDMRLRLIVWVNHLGRAGVHLIQSAWYKPLEITAAFHDVHLGTNFFFNRANVAEVRSYDPATTTSTLINNGTTGANYQEDYRRYATTGITYFGDDEGVIAGTAIPARRFGILATGLLGRAVGIGNILSPIGTGLALNLADFPAGNEFSWSQTDTPTGHDAEGYTMFGHASAMTGRWHDHDSIRTIDPGWSESGRFLFTSGSGAFTGIESLLDDMHQNNYNSATDGVLDPRRETDVLAN